MTYDYTFTKSKIQNSIVYNLIVCLIFVFWYFYSTGNNTSILTLICFIIFLIILTKFLIQRKFGFTSKDIALYLLLFFIPFSLYISIIFYSNASLNIFIPFDRLVGMNFNHNIFLFLIYASIISLKLLGIKIYFSRNNNILEVGQGDEIFQFFTTNIDYKKVILLIILFPISAFVEELIYRSLLISVFTYYLNLNYILTIIIISIIFGLVHYSTSHNWGHVISTLLSSIVYSLALIQLGILYPWLFHLSTNLFVLLFYYQKRKKKMSFNTIKNS